MTTMEIETMEGFHSALAAPARSPEIPESADVYGWLVGSWALEITLFKDGQCVERGKKGEVHFGWVLEGRAVQDVWIRPVRTERSADMEKKFNTYGTTLRVWDPTIQAWRVTWINPAQRRPQRAHRPPGRQGYRSGRRRSQWHAHSLEFHRDYHGLVQVDG